MSKITYKKAGVDIEAGWQAVRRIKKLVSSTLGPEVIGGLGGFGGLFAFDKEKYKEPVLVSGTDGVGTKLKLAFLMDKHDSVGIDLVAMCVNDILTCGARPLFFLDYIGCQKLVPGLIEKIVAGIAEGCRQAGCALIGGETAELNDLYAKGEYDLAGFAVGVVERKKIIDGSKIKAGDKIIALGSSGLHSNGFTLVRRVLGRELGEELLTPTRIYVKPILKLLERVKVKGLAHITGGGLPENVERILPEGTQAVIDSSLWEPQTIFNIIQKRGNISRHEMFKVFNMGVGMVLVVREEDGNRIIKKLSQMGERAFVIGEIKRGKREVVIE